MRINESLLERIVGQEELNNHGGLLAKFGHSTPTLEVIEGPRLGIALSLAANDKMVSYLLAEGYQNIALKDRRQILARVGKYDRIDLGKQGLWHIVGLELPPGTALFTAQQMPSHWKVPRFTQHFHPNALNPDFDHAIVFYDQDGQPREFALVGVAWSLRQHW